MYCPSRDRSICVNIAWACPLQRCQLPSCVDSSGSRNRPASIKRSPQPSGGVASRRIPWLQPLLRRSEEHTSELQSPCNLVCRLLLEKKKTKLLTRERDCIFTDQPTPLD